MQFVLVLAYPLLAHLAVTLHIPWLQALALIVLALGVLYRALWEKSRFAWIFFSVFSALCITASVWNAAIYLLYLPPILIPLLFWSVFFRSLLPGKEPLVTHIGEQARGPLSVDMRIYTRKVTIMWTVMFALIASWSALLPWLASPALWSLFTNVINYVLVGALFALEFLYRKYRFRDHDHPSFYQYLRIVINANVREGQ